MDDNVRSRLDALLDFLTDEVAKRLETRAELERATPAPAPRPAPPPPIVPPVEAAPAPGPAPAAELATEPTPSLPPELASSEPFLGAVPDVAASTPSHAAALMARLAIGVLLILVLINIPINAQGTALARSVPNSASLVIANGLLVKEESSPDVYVYRDGAFHWISSLDAFQHYGYRWENVHPVEAGFLNDFEKGNPLSVLLKCDGSPHVYAMEVGQKRWIVDIPTFTAQGYVWQDVRFVPCDYLRNLPEGDSIPPGRGTPPPPVP